MLNWAFDLPLSVTSCAGSAGGRQPGANLGRLLEEDQPVMVFPEGQKGFRESHSPTVTTQRFGRGGFVEVALETGSPIVRSRWSGPRIIRKLGESKPLARAIGSPLRAGYPDLPWLGPLGLLPLPSRWRIEFLEPIDLSRYGPGSSETARSYSISPSRCGSRSRKLLYRGLVKRGPAFLSPRP